MKKTKKVEAKTKGTSRLRWIVGGVACVVAVITLSWSLGMFGTAEDPRVTEIKKPTARFGEEIQADAGAFEHVRCS